MACPMVLQAVWDDIQLLLSLPFTPSTYHVVIARAVGADAKESVRRKLLNTSLCFMILSSFFANVLGFRRTDYASGTSTATRRPPRAPETLNLPTGPGASHVPSTWITRESSKSWPKRVRFGS